MLKQTEHSTFLITIQSFDYTIITKTIQGREGGVCLYGCTTPDDAGAL